MTKVKTPEELVYRALCSHGGMTVRDVSKHLGIERDVVKTLLHRLRDQGEAEKRGEGGTWRPTVPF